MQTTDEHLPRQQEQDAVKTACKHITVFKQPGLYGGWPANGGMWIWGNEIVVVFAVGRYKAPLNGATGSFERPLKPWQARSEDGGENWLLEAPASLYSPDLGGPQPSQLRSPLYFDHPDFAMMFKHADKDVGPSWFYTSFDRCRTWQPPYHFEVPGVAQIAARTDYIARNRLSCIVCASHSKANSLEGRAFCAETHDGGLTWNSLSHIGPEPRGYTIMPSTVTLNGSLVSAIRRKDPDEDGCIDIYCSEDDGQNWHFVCEAASHLGVGNPPSLLRLQDGRVLLIYGSRAVPYGIRARISCDAGCSWGSEIMLRTDGMAADLGYARSVQRPDGTVVSVYYFNGPEDIDRTIQATLWRP